MLEILVDGVMLRGRGGYGSYGFVVTDGGFSGWEGSPSGRRAGVVRPGAHGEYDLPVFKGSRLVTIKGQAIARSAFDLGQYRSQLIGLGADGDAVDVQVKQHGMTLRASARVLDCGFTDRGRDEQPTGKFSLELVCADPRKYGEQRPFVGSSVQVHHYGNFPASPVVEVAGPRTAPYTVTGPGGRQFVVNQSLSAGQTHRIDFRSGRLYRNGSLQIGQTGRSDTWAVPAGQRVTMGISSGSMTVKLADTYM